MNQRYVYIYPLPVEPSSHYLLPHIPSTYVITEHWAELYVLYSSILLAMYFTHGRVYMSMLPSQFIPPTPSTSVSTSPFSLYLYSCPANRSISMIFLGSIYMYQYICFSSSDLLHTVWQALDSSISLQMTQFHFLSFPIMANIPLYICTTSSLSIHLLIDI